MPQNPTTHLPSDVTIAIKHAKLQYKARRIKNLADFTDDGKMMAFVPDPVADETWAVGGQIQFCNPLPGKEEEVIESGEILEFDPDTGKIYVDVPSLKGDRDIHAFQLRYKPFDFAMALENAFTRLENHVDLVKGVLRLACGEIQNPDPAPIPELPSTEDQGIVDDIWQIPWSLLWGPPGTGKTQNVSDALARFALGEGIGKVLVVTPTNIAADEVAHRICSILSRSGKLNTPKGCLVYRGGRGAGKKLSKDYPQCLRDEAYAKGYDAKRRKMDELLEQRDDARHRKLYTEASRINKQLQDLRATLPDETMFAITKGAARVIILTTFRALALVGQGKNPALMDKVIVDEAGMVSRLTTAAMATLGKSVMLAGDPKQIGPIYTLPPGTSKEIRTWLLKSGLSHLVSVKESLAYPHVRFLDLQYRMHPDISKTVSEFTYDGILKDSETAKLLVGEHPTTLKLPKERASCIILDEVAHMPEDVCAKKAATGRGSERDFSAKIAVGLALAASEKGDEVLILTPYRAQVRLLRKKIRSLDPASKKRISVGTIHRHQGAERSVVILDAVKGAISWPGPEIGMLLNVAVSRARNRFILLASQAERNTPILGRLAGLLRVATLDVPIYDDNGQQVLLAHAVPRSAGLRSSLFGDAPTAVSGNLGEEIANTGRHFLASQEQTRLIEKLPGDGHYLVRGVAGSGKSLILANWAVKLLQKETKANILVTFFNKGMKNLLERMLDDACKRHGVSVSLAKQIRVVHEAAIGNVNEKFDAVFVDEAQDLEASRMVQVYSLCKEVDKAGRKSKNFVLFHDDSQNIYGQKTLEEFKTELEKSTATEQRDFADRLSFQGRSSVLRETYRSTQAILGFAINMALDPKQIYSQAESGLLVFMKVTELAEAGLLIRPQDSPDGVYEVRYAERQGTTPIVIQTEKAVALTELAKEVKHLIEEEKVAPGSIMVVSIKSPSRVVTELSRVGVPAVAYGGKEGNDPGTLPATRPDHVRCTTVFSCKGHEAPVVMFANANEIEDLSWMQNRPAAQINKIRRCMLYVALSRAMIRLYVFGWKSPLMDAAKAYAGPGTPIQMVS
ncbi:MAG TPA: hypothetical protein DCM05_13290 [Elusimicrobia bacterium]|nr:hypothetical protein [Elusimicrobiota bacterium]